MGEKIVRVPHQKRSIAKKEKIAEVAYEIFTTKGYFETNTTEIAKQAGVSTGIVYAYFKDKKDILMDCLDRFGGNLTRQICDAIARTTVPGDIHQIARNVLQIFVEMHSAQKLFHDEVMSMQYRDEDVRNYFMKIERAIMSAVSEQLGTYGLTFTFEREQTYILFTLVKGIEDQLAFGQTSDINKEVLIDQCANIVAAMLSRKTENEGS